MAPRLRVGYTRSTRVTLGNRPSRGTFTPSAWVNRPIFALESRVSCEVLVCGGVARPYWRGTVSLKETEVGAVSDTIGYHVFGGSIKVISIVLKYWRTLLEDHGILQASAIESYYHRNDINLHIEIVNVNTKEIHLYCC